jgi:biopolymer transport protein ExbD
VQIDVPRRRPAGIRLTPLIDVVFILLVFFMLASSFLDWRAFPLGLPPADATPDPDSSPIVIHVEAGGGLRIDGSAVTPDALVTRIDAVRGDEPERAVVVQPAGDATVATTVEVLDRLRAASVAGVSLATTPP